MPTSVLSCLAGAVACSGTLLLIYQSHLTFLLDEWRFLLDRQGFSVGVFLDPYVDHIVLAPISIYKVLLALFGMSSALPFQIVSIVIFLVGVVLLFVYLRLRVGDWLALLGSVLILFLGAGSNTLLWPFQIAFSGAIAAGIGALLALDRDDRKGDVIACALLVVSTSFGEVGVMFAAGALVRIALGPSPLRRLNVALLPIVLYGIWYVGWGHKGVQTASVHNLVHSPKFVFDAISQNFASLFGLATPLNGQVSSLEIGLNWGRILLVIALALAIWRLRRVGWRSPGLWGALVAGGAFWFLSALNAIYLGGARTPTTDRYQYPGAIFVLLIAAELLNGARPSKRVLAAATAVTVAAAISGIIFLHDAYRLREYQSNLVRAHLAAVEIGRGHESGYVVKDIRDLEIPDASSYFSAVDSFGSPAFSERQLAASDEVDREAADQVLGPAEGIKLVDVASGADQRAGAVARCHALSASQPGSGLALGPGDYSLRAQKTKSISLARFADQASINLGFVDPGTTAALSVLDDRSNRPWRLYARGPGAMTVCTAVGL